MATCPKCGTANSPGSTFCISCGTDLPHEAEAPAAQQQPAAPPSPSFEQQPQSGWDPPPPPGWSQPAPPWAQQQQQQQQPYSPYGQYQPYGAGGGYPSAQARVYNYMPLAIVSLVVGALGCFVFAVPGIVSLIFASQVDGKANMGDYQGALRSARTAKVWGIIGLAIMAVIVAALAVLAIIGAVTSRTSGGNSGTF